MTRIYEPVNGICAFMAPIYPGRSAAAASETMLAAVSTIRIAPRRSARSAGGWELIVMTDAWPFPDLEPILSVLGALEPEIEAEVKRRRLADPALDAEISVWEQRLLPLAVSTPAAEPSAGLWDRIEAMIEGRSATPQAETAGWTQWSPGVTAKVLNHDSGVAPARFLLLLAQGATYPAASHGFHEQCIVLAGDIIADDVSLVPGDLVRSETGRDRASLRSPGGGMVYIVIRRA